MSVVNRVREIVQPVVSTFEGVEIYDIEHVGGIVRVVLDRPGGIDVDTIGDVTPAISDALDAQDPLPGSKYMLEVSSPGIERKLRTQDHFANQVGNEVTIKAVSSFDGPRRINGVLHSVDGDDFVVACNTQEGAPQSSDSQATSQHVQISLQDIESARTVFHWGEQSNAPQSSSSKKKVPSS